MRPEPAVIHRNFSTDRGEECLKHFHARAAYRRGRKVWRDGGEEKQRFASAPLADPSSHFYPCRRALVGAIRRHLTRMVAAARAMIRQLQYRLCIFVGWRGWLSSSLRWPSLSFLLLCRAAIIARKYVRGAITAAKRVSTSSSLLDFANSVGPVSSSWSRSGWLSGRAVLRSFLASWSQHVACPVRLLWEDAGSRAFEIDESRASYRQGTLLRAFLAVSATGPGY